MRDRKGTLKLTVSAWILILLYLYIPNTHAAGVDLGLCEPVHITCQCGSSGSVQVPIPACTWFYRWRPYCKACEPDIDESAVCAVYRNCLECNSRRGGGCTRCPPGRAGRQCNEVLAQVQISSTPAPSTDHCNAYGNRYVPIEGCSKYKQYDIQFSTEIHRGIIPCPTGLLFDTSICGCNFAAQVTCGGGGVAPSPATPCQEPARNSLQNGRVVVTSSSGDQTLRYECNGGFTLEGEGTNRCVGGEWANSPPSCIADSRPASCAAPDLPPHAAVITDLPQTSYEVGSSVRVGCDHGYEHSGSRDIICTPAGTWQIDEPITCTSRPGCQDPGTPRNSRRTMREPRTNTGRSYNPLRRHGPRRTTNARIGRRTSRLGRSTGGTFFPVDTRLVFECESRQYKRVGSKYRTCRADGQWSGRQPICSPVCGKSGASRTAFITNGNATQKGQWPWQAAISRDDITGSFALVCGGALLNSHWLVTAGHCVTKSETGRLVQPNHFKIHLGRYYRDERRMDEYVQEFEAERILVNENFNFHSLDNDVALIKLSSPVGARLSNRVRPVCLSDSAEESAYRILPGQKGLVTGWGTTEEGTNAASLKQAFIPVIDSEVCEESYLERGFNVPVTSNMFCAGYENGGIDACNGDSGGPMVFSEGSGDDKKWFLEGIVSWGSPTQSCGAREEYGGYTKVAKFLDWIHESIAG